jgi:hypothetical protein
MTTYQTIEYTNSKWDDSQVPATAVRPSGTLPPTWEAGFKGNANMFCLNFVNTQADEIFFNVQLPHARKTNSLIYPHVHFTPFAALGAGTYAGQFILEYYYAGPEAVAFSAIQTKTLTKTWSNEQQWVHMMASVAGYSLDSPISTILACRLYRDNTVANNFAGKLTYLGFDIHVEIDTPGGGSQPSSK